MRTPSHSTVVAYLALFVALGGSAYAVSKIGSAQIENRSIKGKDVADDALGGRQIVEAKLSGPLAAGAETSVGCDPASRRARRLHRRDDQAKARERAADHRDSEQERPARIRIVLADG